MTAHGAQGNGKAPAGAPREAPAGGFRILVVEDEMLVAMDLEAILRDDGYAVLPPVPDVDRALAQIDAAAPDAAVLDRNLRDRSSAPIARALLARRVPFVVLSGYDGTRQIEPELADARYLRKPVTPDELLSALADALR